MNQKKKIINKKSCKFDPPIWKIIKFHLSSTYIVLLQFQKKIKKPHYLVNDEFHQKSA